MKEPKKLYVSEKDSDLDVISAGINMIADHIKFSYLKKTYLESILENLPDSIAILKKDGSLIYSNRAFNDLFNISKTSPNKPKTIYELIGNLPDITSFTSKEIQLQCKELIIPIEIKLSKIQDSSPTEFTCTIHDLSSHKKLLQEQVKLNKELNSLLETKENFVTNMNHELKTPLNAIIGFAHLLKESSPLTEKQNFYINNFHAASEQLLNIVNNVLFISNITTNRIIIEKKQFNLECIIKEIVNLFSSKAQEKELELRNVFKPSISSEVYSSPNFIQQILINLLNNSLKFTKYGYISLETDILNKEETTYLHFKISDTGIGLGSKIDTLFETFTQGDMSIRREYGGTGLGLSIVKGLLDLLGGTIIPGNQEGGGAIFEVLIPIEPVNSENSEYVDIAKNTQESYSHLNISSHEIHKVLVAEDNEFNQLVIQSLLEEMGFQVEMVDDGRKALDKFITDDFSLIILDIQMPVLDGIRTLREMQSYYKQCKKNAVPIIAFTANSSNEDRDKYLNIGFDDFIPKPVKVTDLKAILGNYFPSLNNGKLNS